MISLFRPLGVSILLHLLILSPILWVRPHRFESHPIEIEMIKSASEPVPVATERSDLKRQPPAPKRDLPRVGSPSQFEAEPESEFSDTIVLSRPIYPTRSKQLREEGTVILELVYQQNQIKSTLIQSSGYPRLDQAALRSVLTIRPSDRLPLSRPIRVRYEFSLLKPNRFR